MAMMFFQHPLSAQLVRDWLDNFAIFTDKNGFHFCNQGTLFQNKCLDRCAVFYRILNPRSSASTVADSAVSA